MGINEIHPTSSDYVDIITVASDYLPPQNIKYVYEGYAILLDFYRENNEGHLCFYEQSLYVTNQLVKYEYRIEYILSALIYYPYLLNSINPIEISSRFPYNLLNILEPLKLLTSSFERTLPWVKSPLTPREKKKKDYWAEKNLEHNWAAFLAISRTSETAIIKILYALYLLKNINKFPVSSDLFFRIAEEFLPLYSSITETLGLWSIKAQIEDRAFEILQPQEYSSIVRDLEEYQEERVARLNRAIDLINSNLQTEGIKANIVGRPKHIYSLYKKQIDTGKSVREIYDSLGVRVIVGEENNLEDHKSLCYQALGIIRKTLPIAEGVYGKNQPYKDYIEHPKPNGYQSIHITLLFENQLLEVQIRSLTMDNLAEYGAAAHWIYKKGGNLASQKKIHRYLIEHAASLRKSLNQ